MSMNNLSVNYYDNLKSLLLPLQTELGVRIYQDEAPKTATHPYIVFRVEDLIDTSPSYNATLKLMVWDIGNVSSAESLALADKLLNEFNKQQKVFTNMSTHTTFTLGQSIPSEHLVGKQCIEQQYDVRIYQKGE